MRVSAIIITKNAGTMIRRCVESVAWADEIIVVDSGSTDDTAEICRAMGVKFSVTADFPGFGPQKNRALGLATGDWVLDAAATTAKRAALRKARLDDSLPAGDWWQQERAKVLAKDVVPEVHEMYSQSMSFAKFDGEFRRFWQVPADFSFSKE